METNDQEEVFLEQEVEDTYESDSTDWKAKHDELAGRLKRAETKLQKTKIESKVEEKLEKKLEQGGLDRLDKLLLRQEGIKSADELQLVEDYRRESGKSLEDILESRVFKAELKDLRDLAASKDATPSGTKRSGQSPRDEVDYWIAKGELPKDNPELARKVVNAKIQKDQNKNQFADQAVIK